MKCANASKLHRKSGFRAGLTSGSRPYSGFPVELVGFDQVHAAFLNESRTRGFWWAPCRKSGYGPNSDLRFIFAKAATSPNLNPHFRIQSPSIHPTMELRCASPEVGCRTRLFIRHRNWSRPLEAQLRQNTYLKLLSCNEIGSPWARIFGLVHGVFKLLWSYKGCCGFRLARSGWAGKSPASACTEKAHGPQRPEKDARSRSSSPARKAHSLAKKNDD
jgi:hypothetical protein